MYRIFSEFAMLESIHANSKISKFELNLSLSNLETPGVSTWADFFHGYPPVGNSIAQHRGVPGLGWILNLEYPWRQVAMKENHKSLGSAWWNPREK